MDGCCCLKAVCIYVSFFPLYYSGWVYLLNLLSWYGIYTRLAFVAWCSAIEKYNVFVFPSRLYQGNECDVKVKIK